MHNYQHLLQRIEKESQDELTFFNQLDPHHFTTSELNRLMGQWEVKDHLFQRVQNITLWVVAFSPVWLVAAYAFYKLAWTKIAILSLSMFSVSFAIFLLGYYLMNVTFLGNDNLLEVEEKIKTELRKRQQETVKV